LQGQPVTFTVVPILGNGTSALFWRANMLNYRSAIDRRFESSR